MGTERHSAGPSNRCRRYLSLPPASSRLSLIPLDSKETESSERRERTDGETERRERREKSWQKEMQSGHKARPREGFLLSPQRPQREEDEV
mmetsp:Transcript_18526/g.28878  ORF Transcript_18526/g.28878 Transcript_18526/m.28878 type:complete len:91 (+) Transcript_18526:65-337(+)